MLRIIRQSVRSMFQGSERDTLLPLLAAGKLQAWGRLGNGFPPLSAIPGDRWTTHFLEYHPAPTGGINQTFLKAKARLCVPKTSSELMP